ncbi:IS4 family transposase [Clostridium sp. Marseille-Q7071]
MISRKMEKVFTKLIKPISENKVNCLTNTYNSDFKTKTFDTFSHIKSMIFLQVSNCNSLHALVDVYKETPSMQELFNLPSVSQISRKNEQRNYQVFEKTFQDIVNYFIKKVGINKASEKLGNIKIMDSTTIQIAAKFAPELYYECGKSSIKFNILYNYTKDIPEKVNTFPSKIRDTDCIGDLIVDDGSIYLFDRGYRNYKWYDTLYDNKIQFITPLYADARVFHCGKRDCSEENAFENVLDRDIILGANAIKNKDTDENKRVYREITYTDTNSKNEKIEIRLLTNMRNICAREVIYLYKIRWKIECFFKWIKQHLTIKHWIGHNENALKIQIYSALISYVLLQILNIESKKNMAMLKVMRIIRTNLLINVQDVPLFGT